MPFETAAQAEDFIFSSYMRVASRLAGPDAQTRNPALARQLLDALGKPDHYFTSILVTGSKGKGSIAVMTAKLLESLGHRVGLVTSPHLAYFRERIRVNGKAISEADLVKYANRIEAPARQIMAGLSGLEYFSPAGLILALACLYFDDRGIDFAVIEAGRGGQYDDCVVLDNPVALFGPVLLEHAAQLGPTVAEIAANKAALLKPGGVGVTTSQSQAAQAVLEGRAWEVGAGLVEVGRELQIINPRIEGEFLRLSVQGRANKFEDLSLPIPALYEAENLAVALGAVEVVSDDRELRPENLRNLRESLRRVKWPGRMQMLATYPLTVADCAVNELSVRSVLGSLRERLQSPVAAIVGVPSDRDWPGVLQTLADSCQQVILTQVEKSILRFPAEAADFARTLFPPEAVHETPDFKAAKALALSLQPSPQTLLILGTQSVIGAALREYNYDIGQL
jgi:dihydrofolate synthase/folylpolyglutamate synthase